jgi:acyl dehydratase
MLEVERPADLKNHVGQVLGVSDWVLVDQPMINAFADATGDHSGFTWVSSARSRRCPAARPLRTDS